jgi:hypothetical protein
MTKKSMQPSQKNRLSAYMITVKGKLAENWAGSFNRVRIDHVVDVDDNPLTTLTCQVQDQAELSGILNWISNMNLVLLEVKAIREEKNDV